MISLIVSMVMLMRIVRSRTEGNSCSGTTRGNVVRDCDVVDFADDAVVYSTADTCCPAEY